MPLKIRYLIVYILLGLTTLFLNLWADLVVPMNRSFDRFPVEIGDWRMVSQTSFDSRVLETLKPTDYLFRQYQIENVRQAELYIGYHGGGKQGGEIHSPKHCLPGSGWREESRQNMQVDVGGSVISVVQAVYRKGDSRQVLLYWFQVRDHTITGEYALKAAQIINSLRYCRRDASFIRVSLPIVTDADEAAATGKRFIRDLYPIVKSFLPA